MLYELSDLRGYKAFIYLLGLELLEKGQSVLGCFVETSTDIRFAEFFGFKDIGLTNDHGQIVMLKDLHV